MERNNKDDNLYEIWYETSVTYDLPRSDSVPLASPDDASEELLKSTVKIEAAREAIKPYLDAHHQQFSRGAIYGPGGHLSPAINLNAGFWQARYMDR